MARRSQKQRIEPQPPRVRRAYFESRYGQLHVHHAMPPGGGFDEATSLVCLHPVPGSASVYRGLLGLVGVDRSVYAVDLPGCGSSDGPESGVSPQEHAAAIGEFLDLMRLRRIDVLGAREGAIVAAELALARPEQVRRVVLADLQGATLWPQGEALAQLRQPVVLLHTAAGVTQAPRPGVGTLRHVRVVDLDAQGADVLERHPDALVPELQAFLAG